MHFLIKTLQNCDNQSFQQYFTEKVCFNESTIEKLHALNHLLDDVLSKRKYFISETFLVKQVILEDCFPRGASGTLAKYRMEHFPTRLDSWQTLATVARAPPLHMAGVLKPPLVTKTTGDRDHQIMSYIQKLPPEVFCKKIFSQKF